MGAFSLIVVINLLNSLSMTSSADFLDMQLNMRQNQSELADFMSDLQSWERDIKEKDEAIKSIGTSEHSTSGKGLPVSGKEKKGKNTTAMNGSGGTLPPVRNIATKPRAPSKAKSTEINKDENSATNGSANNANGEKPAKIKSYDYRSWDKFDVDKACEQIETSSSAKN